MGKIRLNEDPYHRRRTYLSPSDPTEHHTVSRSDWTREVLRVQQDRTPGLSHKPLTDLLRHQ